MNEAKSTKPNVEYIRKRLEDYKASFGTAIPSAGLPTSHVIGNVEWPLAENESLKTKLPSGVGDFTDEDVERVEKETSSLIREGLLQKIAGLENNVFRLEAERDLLRSEAAENARIIGMSGSREAAWLVERDKMLEENQRLRAKIAASSPETGQGFDDVKV